MATEPSAPHLVVCAHSKYDHWDDLTELPQAVQDLIDALTPGYRHSLPDLTKGGTRQDVYPPLDTWVRSLETNDRLILYWTGHGDGAPTHYLVTRDCPRPPTAA